MVRLINFIGDVIILCLFFRFVAMKRNYWLRGGLMAGIYKLTDSLIRPFYSFSGVYSALIAIACIVGIKGVLFSFLSHPGLAVGLAMYTSVSLFVDYAAQVLFLFLFFSVLLSKHGLHATQNIFVEFIHDVAFSVFRFIKRVVRVDNIVVLFVGSLALLVAAHWFVTVRVLHRSLPDKALLQTLQILIDSMGFFVFILFIRALLSWFRPDPYSEPVRILNALTSPFIQTIRRFFPWCMVGMLDLSPLVAVFAIYLLQEVCRNLVFALLS